jgi:hypothetical protein
MKRLMPLMLLSLVGCGGTETIRSGVVAIGSPVSSVGCPGTKLQVPKSCPIYAPGGGDVDTVEAPLPPGVSALCAVDDAGAAYGIIVGDAPTAQLAILPGGREIGIYLGFEPGEFSPDQVVLSGSDANLDAWAAATNILNQDCCAEGHPDGRLAIQMVALGQQGMLFSLGSFAGAPIQVSFLSNIPALPSYFGRFYVNGPP